MAPPITETRETRGNIPENIKFAKIEHTIKANKAGKIRAIDNKKINMMAVLAGSPIDKHSGLYLYKHVGEKVKKGEPLLTKLVVLLTKLLRQQWRRG